MSPALPLHQRTCSHQSGPALCPADAAALLQQLDGWVLEAAGDAASLTKTFTFPDFHRTMAFVNALAWVAHTQDHHPDLTVGYARCAVRWSTHSVGGLSVNDFICAARVDALFQ
jgi:4a-hydroxytetrahydrobiopterin dehydratase